MAKKDLLGYDKTMNFYIQNKERIDQYLEICDNYEVRPVDVAIQWGIRKGIFPVLGASKPEQLVDTLQNLNVVFPQRMWDELEMI